MDCVGLALGAAVFVLLMSRVAEPARRNLNAVLVGGASGVYLSGGFGVWELAYPAVVTLVVYRGLDSYRFIGLAWLMHASWDLPHHLWGRPIWPFMPTSSFGCVIFDTLIALWFLAGVPDLPDDSVRWILKVPSNGSRVGLERKHQIQTKRALIGDADSGAPGGNGLTCGLDRAQVKRYQPSLRRYRSCGDERFQRPGRRA